MEGHQKLLKKIEEYSIICIFGHTSPDGDCYGSQSALKKFIEEIYPTKKVYILGTGFKKAIPYFGEMDQIDDEVVKESLAILVDCSDIERVEDQRITLAKEIVKIDHHMGSEEAGPTVINISNTSACSTAQMVGEFILDNGFTLSKDVAERIFLGIVTDTGRFQFLASSKGTFALMEKIMEAKIDFQKIYDFLYEGSEIATRVKGYISYHFSTYQGVAYIVLDKVTLRKLHADFNYASTMVNALSLMKGFPVWASFCESEEGIVRVELRSKNLNVQKVATIFGGGGHYNASGCRLKKLKDHEKVVKELAKLIEESC